MHLFILQVLRPFYFYQVFVCAVWFSQNYVIFTCCLILISLISLAMSVWETRKVRNSSRKILILILKCTLIIIY